MLVFLDRKQDRCTLKVVWKHRNTEKEAEIRDSLAKRRDGDLGCEMPSWLQDLRMDWRIHYRLGPDGVKEALECFG